MLGSSDNIQDGPYIFLFVPQKVRFWFGFSTSYVFGFCLYFGFGRGSGKKSGAEKIIFS